MSKKYRDYIRSLPCVITGITGETISPHHIIGYSYVTGKAMGKKSSDLTCIPLEHALHQELHNIGYSSFEKKYNFSQRDALLKTILQAEKDGVINV